MSADLITLLGPDIWLVVKGLTLVFLGVYLAFAFLVVRQIDLLNGVLGTPLSRILQGVALVHFSLAALTLLGSLWLL